MLSNEELAIKGLMICSFASLLLSIFFLSDTAKFLSLLMVVASAFLKKAWKGAESSDKSVTRKLKK